MANDKKKCKCPPEGAPAWMLTYGDMMTLLLCFFVLLVAMMEIKREDEWKVVTESVQRAFGLKTGGGRLPTEQDPTMSMIKRLIEQESKRMKQRKRANTVDPGPVGREQRVQVVREGDRYVVGARITFEPGSAELSLRGKAALRDTAELIRDHNTKIELRGHAAPGELQLGSRYTNLYQLSFARAEAVMDYLSSPEVGLRKERLRPAGYADTEPLRLRVYQEGGAEENRRVEVIWVETLVEDVTRPEVDPSGGSSF